MFKFFFILFLCTQLIIWLFVSTSLRCSAELSHWLMHNTVHWVCSTWCWPASTIYRNIYIYEYFFQAFYLNIFWYVVMQTIKSSCDHHLKITAHYSDINSMVILRYQTLFSRDLNLNVSLSQDKRLLYFMVCPRGFHRVEEALDRTQWTGAHHDHNHFLFKKIRYLSHDHKLTVCYLWIMEWLSHNLDIILLYFCYQ